MNTEPISSYVENLTLEVKNAKVSQPLSQMDVLMARLEMFDGHSEMTGRELDGEIALTQGWKRHGKGWAHWIDPDGGTNRHVPFYTGSLDHALLLSGDSWLAALLWAVSRTVTHFAKFSDTNGQIMKKLILWCCIYALKEQERHDNIKNYD